MESTTAQVFYLILVVLAFLSLVVSNSDATNEELAELEVHNTFKPETCDRKAKATDVITLHYKGTLQNGQVFDSRYVELNIPFKLTLKDN